MINPTLPFGTNPAAPPTSPLATSANAAVGTISPFITGNERSLLEMLTNVANGNANQNDLVARGFQQPGDRGAGFTGTGLRGPGIADVTRDDQNLGPQAGVMKSAQDVAAMAQSLVGPLSNAVAMGPLGMAYGMRNNPAVRGVISNVMNYSDIADKTAAAAARGGPAIGGPKGGGDAGGRPDSLSAAEAQAQMNNAMATNDMGGPKGGGESGGKGDAAGTGGTSEDTSSGGGDKGDGYARGGLIELVGGGKVAQGPGGGMDDLIPTTIDGQRAAALSDGEFVIPADVVSMMGDGSSNAGSRRLYDLVREIREAKTGRGQQANPLQFTDILRRTLG
jgi:hypothetical protein